jgi:hypothetical protein
MQGFHSSYDMDFIPSASQGVVLLDGAYGIRDKIRLNSAALQGWHFYSIMGVVWSWQGGRFDARERLVFAAFGKNRCRVERKHADKGARGLGQAGRGIAVSMAAVQRGGFVP